MEIKNQTIPHLLQARVKKTPDLPALQYQENVYTWQQVETHSDELAASLYLMGMRQGEQVGIWSVNTLNFIITFFALHKVGAVPILLNASYKKKELEQIIAYMDMQYFFYGRGYRDYEFLPVVEALKEKNAGGIRHWISLEEVKGNRGARVSYARLQPEDVACMMFTSGTTGQPKGVMLTHRNLVNNAAATAHFMGWSTTDRQLLVVPLFHCFGITSGLLASVCSGCRIDIMEYFRTREVLKHIEVYRSTVLNGVPTMFFALLRNSDLASYDISSLRNGIIAGAPLTPEEYVAIKKRIPTLDLRQSYGQTETSPCVSLMPPDAPVRMKSESVGLVIPNVEVRIWEEEQQREAGNQMRGEIQVRGYNTMKGYYKLPDETAAVIGSDGWLKTGDIGCFNQEGYLCIAGRKKEMIIRAGENIMPAEIEHLLLQMPYVQAAKVIGNPAPVVQEEIVACLILEKPGYYKEEDFITFLKPQIADYKIPDRFLIFKEFPVNASGKISLAILKKEAAERWNDKR